MEVKRKEEQCIYIDYIGAVASGGVGDSVGHISLFANFDFDSPSPPVRNHQNNETVIFNLSNISFSIRLSSSSSPSFPSALPFAALSATHQRSSTFLL